MAQSFKVAPPRMTPVAQSIRALGPRRSGGFSLVEIMLSAGVASGVAILAMGFGSKAMDMAKMDQSRKLASALASQVESRFSIFPSYSVLPTTPASNWVTDLPMQGPNIAGPWGAMQLQAASVNNTNDAWAMTFNNVPADMCIKMLMTMGTSYYASGANGSYSPSSPNASVSADQAVALCNATSNSVSFISPPSLSSRGSPVAAALAAPTPSTLPVWNGGMGAVGTPVAMATPTSARPMGVSLSTVGLDSMQTSVSVAPASGPSYSGASTAPAPSPAPTSGSSYSGASTAPMPAPTPVPTTTTYGAGGGSELIGAPISTSNPAPQPDPVMMPAPPPTDTGGLSGQQAPTPTPPPGGTTGFAPIPVPGGMLGQQTAGPGSTPNGCFSLDTLVLTARGPVPIREICAGDQVVSLWIQDLEIDDPKVLFAWRANELPDAFELAEVVHVHAGGEPGFYRINGSLEATWEHPIMTQRDGVWQWTRARDLVPGDTLRSLDGVATVESVVYVHEPLATRNLDVISPYDNFLVKMGDSWVLAHNEITVTGNKY